MKSIDVHDAEARLSQLVEAAANGDETILAKNGKPIARLVAAAQPRRPRRFGVLKGQIRIADDFDAPLPRDVIASFEGR